MNTVPPVLQRPGASKIARRNRKMFIFLAIVLAFVALAVFLIFGRRTPPIIIQSENVARRNLTEIVVANGKIQPVLQVTISPEVSGEIIDLPVKEGQHVKKGELLVKIDPDVYVAALNQAKAGYESAMATEASAKANLEKAQNDYDRNLELFHRHLLAESDFDQFKVTRDMDKAQVDSAEDQVDVQKAAVESAQASLGYCTIISPLDGTISQLNCQVGDRVLGTIQNEGTVIMIVSDLSKMEARVDVGEMDVVGIAPGQKATLDVDAFKDKKFTGVVTDVASSSQDNNLPGGASSGGGNGQTQEATKFEVRIRIKDKEAFRPGMSVSADIETTYRTNVLTVPLASVTTRSVAKKADPPGKGGTNSVASVTNSLKSGTNSLASGTNSGSAFGGGDAGKLTDVVFVLQGDRVKAVPVTIGICDDNYWEITSGLTNGEEIVSGGYKAISRDLQDGSKIKKGPAVADASAQK
ncbi:MAG TPA: efflux RND transporter periplasmic adaptor subunit [Verrucomicrobiae bacterium]|nr:efflux RND transporter periplasmic adaptor subunit [Verrucomicrobiae bacterium]